MPYLTEADLKTHLYDETVDEIHRTDGSIVTTAISAAIAEAKSYLGRYDTAQLFHDTTPVPVDENLKNKVKDIVCWHLVKLANPNVNFEVYRTAYQDAIRWLEMIMKQQLDPEGWILKTDDPNTEWPEDSAIHFTANTKRNNHF
jgi:phage gp36-like protein